MPVTARTTFMPWIEIEMEQGEYDSLRRQGLIVPDDPAPETDEVSTAADVEAPSASRGARRATAAASK
jgi:hypothetical protein